MLGYAPADVAPEFPSLSSRRYSCYLRLLLCAAALQTWQLPEPLPNYMVCMLYVPCDSQDKERVNNSKLRATQHKTKGKTEESGIKAKTFFFSFHRKIWVAKQHDTLRLKIARSWNLSFVHFVAVPQ